MHWRTDVEAETLILWPPDMKNWLTWKGPDVRERLKVGGEGEDRGWDGWMALATQLTWVWVNFGSWWCTRRPGVLQSMGLQRVRHNWANELTLYVFTFYSLTQTKKVSLCIFNHHLQCGIWKIHLCECFVFSYVTSIDQSCALSVFFLPMHDFVHCTFFIWEILINKLGRSFRYWHILLQISVC